MKKLYTLALGLAAVLGANADVTIGETSYKDLLEAANAAVDGDVLTVNGTVEVGARVTVENKSITIQGADAEAVLKRKWGNKTMLIKAGDNGTINLKNITWSGSTVDAGSSFECSANTAVMNFENVKFIEIKQNSNYTIDQKGGGTVNIKNLTVDYSLSSFAMDGDKGWTVREGNDKKVSISGTNDFCMYVQNNYLVNVIDLVGSDITIGFDPAGTDRMTSKRAIIRGTGDADQIKSGVPGYALEKEGSNKNNLRIVLAPLAVSCDDSELSLNNVVFADGETYNFKIDNVGNGIEYTYTLAEGSVAPTAETAYDPATGITVDKEGVLTITALCANMNEPNVVTRTITISKNSGIEDVTVEGNAPVEYYNLQGVRVANPENGLFIRRQGNKTTKVMF